MKVGYTVFDRPADKGNNYLNSNLSSNQFGPPSPVEGAALFSVAVLGGLGNTFVMIVTLTCPKFRQMSSAFIFHHCLLDAIKSIFCLPFGYSLLMQHEIPHCDILGAAYILLMTVSAYNLLALLINEEYQCSYMSKNRGQESGDSCCIAFGVVIIWFTTVLLHLGVAFLPGSSEFSRDIGNCVYRYGITKNYVIHALWVILVTGAIVVAAFSFFHFYRKLQSTAKSRKWTFLHKSLSSLNQFNAAPAAAATEEVQYEFEDATTQTVIIKTHHYMRRLMILLLMVVSFVVCWYPLFLLTLFDVHYQQPARLYRILMIIAWTHPLTTPVFCAIIYYDQGWGYYKECYTNAIPMTVSRSSHTSGELNHLGGSANNLTFLNQNFHWGANHTDSPARHPQFPEYSSPQCETVTNYNAEEGACQTLIM